MLEGRAEQVVLISPLSTGDARGTNSLLWVTCCEGYGNMLDVHLSALSCAVSLSVNLFFSSVYPAERCALNGKVKVMLLTMCSQLMSCTRLHSEKDTSETQYQSRA